ncbi:hypothetical protein KEJ51_08215 [Candidatus Bathyarchaeota archaeon]|nr:hypothetical protein [Candidatus Bathyarchaeota archaeon]
MNLFKKRGEIDIFTGGEGGLEPTGARNNVSGWPLSLLGGADRELAGTILFTSTTIAALMLHYNGLALTIVAATFLAGPAVKLLLSMLK